MEFLKDHYEKLVLGVIVIGLVVAAVMVSMQAGSTDGEMDGFGSTYQGKAQPVDTSTYLMALARFSNASPLNFDEGHYLFNPDIWRRKPDGSFITGEELGPKGVKIVRIEPLISSIKFLDTGVSSSTRAALQIVRVNAPDRRGTPPTTMSTVMMSVGEENDLFKLLEARPPEAPKEVLLEMKKDGQLVTLAKDQVFERVDGYIASLRYDAENRNFNNVREESTITLLGETNRVVTLSSNEIVLLNPATTLKTTLKYNAAP